MDILVRSWILNFVAVGIIGVVVDLMLSESDLRKYARFVIGVIMLIAILRPVLQLFDRLPRFDEQILNNFTAIETMDIEELRINASNDMRELAIRMFKNNLERQVEEQVRTVSGYPTVGVTIELGKDEKGEIDIGVIKGIWVELSEDKSNLVETVRIDIIPAKENEKAGSETQNLRSVEINSIKEHLSEFYNVSGEVIHIRFEEVKP